MTQADPIALSLAALAATLGDPRRAQRFLDLTGVSPDDLRVGAGSPGMLVALLTFLEGHEPDLLAVSGELGVNPADLVAARHSIEKEAKQ